MFSVRRPTDDDLTGVLAREEAHGRLSYPEVGATREELPRGYRHDRWDTDLGADEGDRFTRAVEALRHWEPQRGSGLRVVPELVVDGATLVLVIQVGLLYATAAGRVVYLDDEPNCYRFAYGTLESHPEIGEEAFAVRRANGRVVFEIVAFSRPSHALARLGSPVTRALQLHVTRSYLAAMQRATA